MTNIKFENAPEYKKLELKESNQEEVPLLEVSSSREIPQGNSELDKKSITNYLDYCKTNKQYALLVQLIPDMSEVSNPKAYISWTEKPKTVGSLAIVYLCNICKQDPDNLMPFLDNMLPTLVEYIKTGTDDLRDNSLMLLFYTLDHLTEEKIVELLELNIFSVLMRSIMCSKQELRHLTAGVCYKIYKNRPYAQKLFIDMNGGRQLVQQISWSSENDVVLRTLLDYLSELLQDKDDKVMQGYIAKLNEEKAIDIIRDINNSDKSTETLEAMDYLIGLLSSTEDTLE